jgi:hypothetical protein
MEKEMNNIRLETFIAESLKQIISGISKAQKEAKDTNTLINPLGLFVFKDNRGETIESKYQISQQTVDFDVVVTALDQDKSKGGFGIFVGGVGVGIQGQTDVLNSTVNRIKFSVPIYFPHQMDEHTENKPTPKPGKISL